MEEDERRDPHRRRHPRRDRGFGGGARLRFGAWNGRPQLEGPGSNPGSNPGSGPRPGNAAARLQRTLLPTLLGTPMRFALPFAFQSPLSGLRRRPRASVAVATTTAMSRPRRWSPAAGEAGLGGAMSFLLNCVALSPFPPFCFCRCLFALHPPPPPTVPLLSPPPRTRACVSPHVALPCAFSFVRLASLPLRAVSLHERASRPARGRRFSFIPPPATFFLLSFFLSFPCPGSATKSGATAKTVKVPSFAHASPPSACLLGTWCRRLLVPRIPLPLRTATRHVLLSSPRRLASRRPLLPTPPSPSCPPPLCGLDAADAPTVNCSGIETASRKDQQGGQGGGRGEGKNKSWR